MPIEKPTLAETLKLKMVEQKFNQKRLAEILGVNASIISEYLAGKSEPTLKIGRKK